MPFLLFVWEFFKGILANSHILFVFFAIRTGVFLKDVKLGILILIMNITLKIQNEVIIRKKSKNKLSIFQ